MKFTARETVLAALFVALIIIGAFVRIPVGTYVISLQPIFTLLAGLVLGAKLGAIAVTVYILMGLIGIPVFTAGGGPQYVLQPTFGFLFAFIIQAFICGKLSRNLKPPKFLTVFVVSLISLVFVYVIGLFYFYMISVYVMGMEGQISALIAIISSGAVKDVVMAALVSKISIKLYHAGYWLK